MTFSFFFPPWKRNVSYRTLISWLWLLELFIVGLKYICRMWHVTGYLAWWFRSYPSSDWAGWRLWPLQSQFSLIVLPKWIPRLKNLARRPKLYTCAVVRCHLSENFLALTDSNVVENNRVVLSLCFMETCLKGLSESLLCCCEETGWPTQLQ